MRSESNTWRGTRAWKQVGWIRGVGPPEAEVSRGKGRSLTYRQWLSMICVGFVCVIFCFWVLSLCSKSQTVNRDRVYILR